VYKAFYTSGSLEVQADKVRDFRWALQDDLWSLLDEKTKKALANILYDEEP
jgi:hypothetical protein